MTAVVAVAAMLVAAGIAVVFTGNWLGLLAAATGSALLYWVETWQ